MTKNTSWRLAIACILVVFVSMGAVSCAGIPDGDDAPPAGDADKPALPAGDADKLALLVGIDDYRYNDTGISDLRGAKNDVAIMKELLVTSFGFRDDGRHIRVLTDGEATRDGIITAFKEHLIDKANRDSIVVFQFSGHGSRLPDIDGDETSDNLDETLVTHDSSHGAPHPNRDITDDEINEMMARLTAITPHVTFIFDSCHSGTTTRGAGLARTATPDTRIPPRRRPIFGTQATRATTRGVAEGKNDLRPENARYVLISGSAAHERSHEVVQGGMSYGVMTWNLVRSIREAGASAITSVTYRDVMDRVTIDVGSRFPAQHPQLEGPGSNRYVFDHKSLVPAPSVSISEVRANTVTLKAGRVHGVTEGSIYAVYAPRTKSFGEGVRPIAGIEIIEVGVTTSKARVIGGRGIETASRAVEWEHNWPDAGFKVHFMDVDRSRTLRKIRDELAAYRHIEEQKQASGYDLLLREGTEKQGPKGFIITEFGDPATGVTAPAMGNFSPPVGIGDKDTVSKIVKQVIRWARWFNIRGIENPNPGIEIGFRIKPATGKRTDASVATLSDGGECTVEITNKSKDPVYVALLDLSSNGSVALVFPSRREQIRLSPGRKETITLKGFVPEGRQGVRDILKLFATTEPTNYGLLMQQAVRGGAPLPETRGKSRSSLEELLANAARGTARNPKAKTVKTGMWTTAERVIEVEK
uniref:Caspase domain-containing protein n=1 Tax=Candidatus Kentrum sp. LFY TaxID=2126342 RepID=A0A450U4Q4_9GAMM|nr:MAG: Caspase domain-containing protein [Candidatus Kentron sp. LFY]